MVVEIKAIVLDWTETRDTQFRQRSDIRAARMLGEIKNAGAGALQDFRDRVEESFSFRFRCEAHPERVTGTAIGLDRGEMIRDFFLVVFRVSLAAREPVFFVHPRDHPDRALRAQVKFGDEIRGFHGNGNPGAVIDRTGPEVPRIEVPGNNDDLLGMLAPFDIADDVEARRVRKRLRRQHEAHFHRALLD